MCAQEVYIDSVVSVQLLQSGQRLKGVRNGPIDLCGLWNGYAFFDYLFPRL
jgi:hypothetical protein